MIYSIPSKLTLIFEEACFYTILSYTLTLSFKILDKGVRFISHKILELKVKGTNATT